MANIAIFVGRKHHAQKLMNIGRFLAYRGHVVFPLTANNAINIDPPQDSIGDYVHAYHYLTREDVSGVDSYIQEKEVRLNVPQFWKDYSLRELMLSYLAFNNYLKSDDKPDAVLILHENNFWTKPLSFLCEQLNIPCFAFQEGLLRQKDQDDMKKQTFACEYATKLFVWGDDSRNQYIDAGIPEDKVIVSGPSHLITSRTRTDNERKRVVYFMPLLQHYYGNPQQDIEAISAYCKENNLDFAVRMHPFEQSMDIPFVVDNRDNVVDVILDCDLALVQHSTTALECLVLGTPVIEVAFGQKGFIEPLHKKQELIPVIKNYIELGIIKTVLLSNYLPLIEDWIDEQLWLDGAKSLDIIANEIEAHLD